MTSGIAYAWHPHRDTWYSAPQCKINWWMPVFELASENAMAFHSRYWNRPVKNNSDGYNYYEWNKLYRGAAVTQILKEDPRPLPRATEDIELEPQLRLICPVGGIIIFSGALMEHYPNFGTDLLNPDFAAYARDCGGAGFRVEKPGELKGTIEKAMSLNLPVIVDIETDPRRFP